MLFSTVFFCDMYIYIYVKTTSTVYDCTKYLVYEVIMHETMNRGKK